MPKTNKSYRELMQELDAVMQELQASDLDIDAAIAHYEKGVLLTKEISAYLTRSENKLIELRKLASED